MGVTIPWAISCGLESSSSSSSCSKQPTTGRYFSRPYYYPPSYKEGRALATPHKKLPLFTEMPRRLILGNSYSYARIPVPYRGVGKRACSASFLEEFFSETRRTEGSNLPYNLSP